MSNSQINRDESIESEISIRDIFDFLTKSWKVITIFGALGLIAAMTYIWITPTQYQASAQIQMGQFASNSSNTSSIMSPIGVNIEEPSRLILRLQTPVTYSDEVVSACGLKGAVNPREKLAKLIKASPVKGTTSIVEMLVNRESKELALSCMGAIFDEVGKTQAEIAQPFFQEITKNLTDSNLKIEHLKASFRETTGGASPLVLTNYLLVRDEINRLAENIMLLEFLIDFKDARKTKLVSDIYVSADPVYPKKNMIILLGLIGGLLAGMLIALLKRFI